MSIPDDERRRGRHDGSEPAAEAPAGPRRRLGGLPIPLLGIAAALLIAAAAYTVFWMIAAAELEARVAGWIEDRRAEGFRIEHGPLSRGGFPRRLRMTVAPLEMVAPAGWTWNSPGVQIDADPLAPRTLQLSASGTQDVRLPPAQGGRSFTVEAERLDLGVVAGDGMAVGNAAGARVVLRAAGSAEADSLRIGRLDLVSTPGPSATPSSLLTGYRFNLTAADIVLPSAAQTPLGERIDRVSLLTEVTGDAPADAAAMPWPKALAQWRDEGGTIEVRGLSVDYGPLQLTGDGTLALDKTGEPIGAFSLQASGLLEALRMLAENGTISPAVAAGAAFVFRPARGKSDGAGAAISLPASLQDRKLYLGPLAVARVPSPPWVPLPEPGR